MASLSTQQPKRNPRFWKDTLTGYLFILPVVLGLIIFTFGPMIASAYYSLTTYKIVDPPEFIGFQNYIDLFTNDRRFNGSMEVTWNFAWRFIIAGQTISLLMAVLLTQKVRGQAIFRTLFYMPMVVPFVASSLLWRYLFNREFGPINAIVQWFGFDAINWLGSPDWALNSLVIMSIWGGAVSTIIYVAGLQNVPEELLEAAKIDGANAIQRFLRITIPLLTPTIFFNVVTNVIGAFQFFVPAFIMTNGGPVGSTYFYNLNLYDKAFKWLQMGYASAMAWVMFGIIIVLTLLIFRSSALWVYYEGEVRK
jgi:multiple sugar transport system permease protein